MNTIIVKILKSEHHSAPGKLADAEIHFSGGELDGLIQFDASGALASYRTMLPQSWSSRDRELLTLRYVHAMQAYDFPGTRGVVEFSVNSSKTPVPPKHTRAALRMCGCTTDVRRSIFMDADSCSCAWALMRRPARALPRQPRALVFRLTSWRLTSRLFTRPTRTSWSWSARTAML